ncbi:MAG: hypothetical protein AAFP04_05655 [Myxococcota bacterium]
MASTFGKFLAQLDPSRLTAAIIPLLGDKEWARQALGVWAKSPDASGPVKRAIKALTEKDA